MPDMIHNIVYQFAKQLREIYGDELKKDVVYGSYARGDFRSDLDVDIMILLDLSDLELKAYGQQLSYMTYDFNMDHDLDIKPIAKSEKHFLNWVDVYPFYANVKKEGVKLFDAA